MPDTPYAPKGPASQPGKRAGHESAGERRRDADIPKLKAELAAQAALIARQEVSLAHSRKIFDRASVAARIGVWECSLPGEQLHWTDVVYDLFDLPRGSVLDRSLIVYGSGMSNGNGHTPYPLPHIVAGGAAGGVKGNRHLVAPEHSPNANLMLSVADKFGLQLDRFGVSTGRLEL